MSTGSEAFDQLTAGELDQRPDGSRLVWSEAQCFGSTSLCDTLNLSENEWMCEYKRERERNRVEKSLGTKRLLNCTDQTGDCLCEGECTVYVHVCVSVCT